MHEHHDSTHDSKHPVQAHPTEDKNSVAEPNCLPEIGAVKFPECQHFGPGHSIHTIHYRLAMTTSWVGAHLGSVSGNFIQLITLQGVESRWNHDARELQVVSDIVQLFPDVTVAWNQQYSMLMVRYSQGGQVLYLAEQPGPPCVFPAPPKPRKPNTLGYKGRNLFE